jgi:ABC-2 type transport system permease protein
MLVLPIAISASAISNPESVLVQVLSYIPFTLPAVMLLKINVIDIPATEIITTVLIMILSIYFTIFAASKIFRIGILSYGKRPGLKELISWIKEK